MSMRSHSTARTICFVLGLFVIAGAVRAQHDGRYRDVSAKHRFNFVMAGGFGFSEDHQGMVDLKTELQYGLTSRIRFGLGIGYIHGDERIAFWRTANVRKTGKTDSHGRGPLFRARNDRGGFRQAWERDFRVMPLSLNVYYALPLGRKWNVFMSGGGSYYFGWFHIKDERQNKNDWGGQGGFGLEFRLNSRIGLVAQGEYRFVDFEGLKGPGSEKQTTLGTYGPRHPEMSLTGANVHLGVKFSF